LLVNHQSDWREKSALNVMVRDTSKEIVPSRELSPLEKWKKFKLLRKQLVRREPRTRIKL